MGPGPGGGDGEGGGVGVLGGGEGKREGIVDEGVDRGAGGLALLVPGGACHVAGLGVFVVEGEADVQGQVLVEAL